MATNTRRGESRSPSDAPGLLREVARLHVRAQRATLACDGASSTACTILTELGRASSMTLAQLSRRLRLDKSWTSRAVDQLVQEDLVKKAVGDDDRRTVVLSVTRAGHAQHRRLEALLNNQVARVIGRVPGAQRATVTRALRLLHEAYVAELADERADAGGAACAIAS